MEVICDVTLLLKNDPVRRRIRVHGYCPDVEASLGDLPTSCTYTGGCVFYEVVDPRAPGAAKGRIVELPFALLGSRNDLNPVPPALVKTPPGVIRAGPFYVRAAEWWFFRPPAPVSPPGP